MPIRVEPERRADGVRRGCRRASFLPEVYHAHHEARAEQESSDKREGEERGCDEDCGHATSTFPLRRIRYFRTASALHCLQARPPSGRM